MKLLDIYSAIKKGIRLADQIAKSKSTEIIQAEVTELEQIYATLVFGSFIGLPSPPTQITLDLLPVSENSIKLLLNRLDTTRNPLSALASIFRVD